MNDTETPINTGEIANDRVAALERELAESRESEKYWSGLARSGSGSRTPAPEPEPEPEEDGSEFLDDSVENQSVEGDTPEKLIDEFASEGVKALAKRGFITAKDAQKIAVDTAMKVSQSMIARERGKMDTDSKILGEFPELKDQTSELFKETAKRYQKAVAMDPNAKKTPAALYLAADAAKEAIKYRSRRDDPDDEPESDRRRRADSQDARPRGRSTSDDGDDMMGSEARQIIRQMGISEAEFKAQKKETSASGQYGRRNR